MRGFGGNRVGIKAGPLNRDMRNVVGTGGMNEGSFDHRLAVGGIGSRIGNEFCVHRGQFSFTGCSRAKSHLERMSFFRAHHRFGGRVNQFGRP